MQTAGADELEAIRQLKARYCRTVDTKDWVGFRAVFADDAKIGPIESGFPEFLLARRRLEAQNGAVGSGLDAFMARVIANMTPLVSVHHVHQSEISLTRDGEAEGVWAMQDLIVWPNEGYRFHGTGHYWETYRKIGGEWRIASIRLTRLHFYTVAIESGPE